MAKWNSIHFVIDSNQEETEEWSKICYAYDFVEDLS